MNFENLTVGLHFLIIFFILEHFQKHQRSLLHHRTNVKISIFCDLNLCIKNNFIDRTVNNIQFKRNFICMNIRNMNLTVKFLNFVLKKELHDKFEEFL